MSSFKWTKAHSAFVPEIDAEHRTLFRLGAELHEAVSSGADTEHLASLMRALAAAAEDHFSHEERSMRSTHYPLMTWHKQQHEGARRRLKHFALSFERGDSEAPGHCAAYVEHWLKDHTSVTDRMLGAHLRACERLHAVAS